MFRAVHIALIFSVFSLASYQAAPAKAQNLPPARYCDQEMRVSAATKRAACTAMIESGEFSGQLLADIYLMRGRVYAFDMRSIAHALADYERALALHPRYAAVYYYRSLLHKYNGDNDK